MTGREGNIISGTFKHCAKEIREKTQWTLSGICSSPKAVTLLTTLKLLAKHKVSNSTQPSKKRLVCSNFITIHANGHQKLISETEQLGLRTTPFPCLGLALGLGITPCPTI